MQSGSCGLIMRARGGGARDLITSMEFSRCKGGEEKEAFNFWVPNWGHGN